ncbi:DM13 domain-containing protein [Anabaena azotica]|uniref:DM13 domain-containing protein n=1 Tax=Anabaena azotica FACHB-119 TaxID=947527 RepID=A0ABR8D052_9NOST|nr:DM13 domain-containing protein [Anabaena azotica]MBD2500564.1 DM13 domain-containing protein [Anabaena azotica FACHB-119]
MKAKQLVTISLAFLVIVSCTRQISNQQLTTNFANAATTITPTDGNISAPSNKSANKTTIKSGTFVSGEHTTQGTVRITQKEGRSFIELDQSFKTSTSGPDLVVVLHRSDNVIGSTKPPAYSLKKGDYIVIAPLKKYIGTQNYLIPNNINLAVYKSVAIWCRQFNATFGAASLSN